MSIAILAIVGVALFVDLSPRVEGEFFFAEDDPQMQASQRVAADFPAGLQIILRVEDFTGDEGEYRARIERLTASLLLTPGVENAYSISTHDPARSPLYARILLTPDERATNVILLVDETDPEVLLPRIEAVVGEYEGEAVGVVISGVPAIVEQIRRGLSRDLVVFSAAAVLVFALLVGLIYRDAAIVVGTLATCTASVGATLLMVQLLGIGIGLLTANLVTIVFVLTLSHVVFLTANWRRLVAASAASDGEDRAEVVAAAVRETWEGSFWSMATTLLGFASLLVATARPLRELGIAGSIGALTALGIAYALYPSFLATWAQLRPGASGARVARPLMGAVWILPVAAAALIVLGTGLPRVDTDPSLLTYFDKDSDLYAGLARIDRDGGSSPLDIVVEDPAGRPVSDAEVFSRLEDIQVAFERDPAVGVVLSPTVLIEHARTIPLAGLLPVGMLLDISMSDALDGVGLGFVRPDGSQARFSLRMRETAGEDRDVVMARLRATVSEGGLRPVAVSGLYALQAELGDLMAASLRIGIGGLLLLFFGVALVVGRSGRAALTMWLCLAGVPVVILGVFGHMGIAMDIITSPAANIALAVGADSMIHLVIRMRRLSKAGERAPWTMAVAQIGPPVVRATGIVCVGFGIFVLSSFPPTQRFGLAVIVGTIAASAMTLIVLPRAACLGSPDSDRLSPVTG